MNLDTLNKYHEEGWLIKQSHPYLGLTIWNYSQQTQYESKWDDITLACRGLVTMDDTGEIIARPFKKFFNMEEGKHTPTAHYDVYAKMDGSLIIAFYYCGSWIFASRGSFTSEQAKAASKLFYREYDSDGMNIDTTYMFEYTSPWNRVVVDYGDHEKLTLLGGIRTDDGYEAPWNHLYHISVLNNIPLVEKYDAIADYSQLKKMINDNEEGYVIKFSNGDRCKIKGEEYIRLHKIMTEVSTKSVWDCLKNQGNIYKLLENVPDEFFNKVKEYVDELTSQYNKIENEAISYFSSISLYSDDRVSFAQMAKRTELCPILFSMLDNKDYSNIIWKMIKPKYRKL